LISKILSSYDSIQIKNQNRWLKQSGLNKYLSSFNLTSLDWQVIGASEEGRKVTRVQIGNGPLKILIWSQMHGNEATGTLAIIELLKLISVEKESFKKLLQKATLYIVPMLNPDGSEIFTRRNALQVDNNRDLMAMTAAETKCLVKQVNEIKPDVAINLHDQRDLFGADTGSPATISFLAPSFNYSRDIDASRMQCMKMIVEMHRFIKDDIPNCIGRYSDEFYPTAIGEFVQQKGIPCILIESGASLNDDNREVARKMNVKAILKLIETVSSESWKKNEIQDYLDIPENKMNYFNIIISNLSLKAGVVTDIGLLKRQTVVNGTWTEEFEITEIGDLQFKYAFEEINARELEYSGELTLNQLANFNIVSLGLAFKNGVRT